MRFTPLFLLALLFYNCAPSTSSEVQSWEKQAAQIQITRDQWGIPHIYGKTDADAVFGLMYAQCEDDFNRVEVNYINALGRMAEVEGESALYADLRMRLFIDSTRAIAIYKDSPEWLKKLMNAFADGTNYFLYTHPEVKPKLITHFEPWMPLLFSEGSIGGDIESISVKDLQEFYGDGKTTAFAEPEVKPWEKEPTGSNGIAIAPSKSATGHSLFLINPHTSFYFRSEVHMRSDEGLNAYGAVTWGQFFIYQGFNEHCGWMHTSTGTDVIDEYEETIVKEGDKLFYKYGEELKPLPPEKIKLSYKDGDKMTSKEFTVYHTQHGPVIAGKDDKWISVSLMVKPLEALTQSYTRTKSNSYEEFKKTMDIRTNSSNNTVYADDQGNIAYFHGNFIPIRDTQFDWENPVDGSNPATDWKGLHTVEESIHVLNPENGWIQNCNSTPFTVSGEYSPDKSQYPSYMAPDYENFRGIHAVRVLKDSTNFTLDKLIASAYDSYLPAFEHLLPALVKANKKLGTQYPYLKEPIQELSNWNLRFSKESVPTTLAIYWAQELRRTMANRLPSPYDQLSTMDYLTNKTSEKEKMDALANAVKLLNEYFGTWKTPWGDVNRFQRVSGDIVQKFDDSKPSIAVGFTSSYWGSLASFGARTYPGTKKMYGTSGNSFVAVVEFGDKVIARTSLAGGESGHPDSPHFFDQGQMYANGEFKDANFYPEDVEKNAAMTYHPGEENKK